MNKNVFTFFLFISQVTVCSISPAMSAVTGAQANTMASIVVMVSYLKVLNTKYLATYRFKSTIGILPTK